MKVVFYILAVIVLLILQLALTDLQIFLTPPNLLLVYICLIMSFVSFSSGLWLALGCGIMLDIFSGSADGVMVISLLSAISLAYYLTRIVSSEKIDNLHFPIYIATSSVLFILSIVLINFVLSFFSLNQQFNLASLLTKELLFSVIINLVAAYPVYWLYNLQFKAVKYFKPKHESI